MRLLQDFDPREQFRCQFFSIAFGHFADPDRRQCAIFQNGEMRKQIEILEHHSDFAPHFVDPSDIIVQLDSINDNRPPLMFLQPINAPNQGRFAGTGWTADHDALSALNRQGDVPQDVKAPVPFVDPGKPNCGAGR